MIPEMSKKRKYSGSLNSLPLDHYPRPRGFKVPLLNGFLFLCIIHTALVLGISNCGFGSTNSSHSISSNFNRDREAIYISPKGANSNSGMSPSSPWKTFTYAIPRLKPGKTLILLDGVYTKSTTGLPNINCAPGGNAVNGTATQPITIIALHERQALLQSDGSVAAFRMNYCSYWDVEGLRGESADLSSTNGGAQYSVFQIDNSNNINLRRLLAAHPNRYFNVHPYGIAYSSNILIEESEAYYFHRHGMSLYHDHQIVARRNYVNSRSYPDLPGCTSTGGSSPYCSRIPSRGDEGIVCYASNACTVENSISEGNDQISVGRGGDTNPPNYAFGDISLNELSGLDNFSSGTDSANISNGNVFENDVIIGSTSGLLENSVKNAIARNITLYGNRTGLAASHFGSLADDAIPGTSFTATNVLSFNNSGAAFSVNTNTYPGTSWLVEYSSTGGGGTSPSTSSQFQHMFNSAPTGMGLGANQCIVYVPSWSNMKGAGKNGADIGANIVYRYEDGILTDQKLWDQTTGQFPCGATVSGVNDIAGSSCFDVNKRLNVGVNGCPIP
jgi:hypothetical protein